MQDSQLGRGGRAVTILPARATEGGKSPKQAGSNRRATQKLTLQIGTLLVVTLVLGLLVWLANAKALEILVAALVVAIPVIAAPWLCAGLIGYRALRFTGNGKRIAIYSFGAAAHMIAQVCRHRQREVFASRDQVMKQRSGSRDNSAPPGRAAATKTRRASSTRRSCSHRSALWCPRHCATCARVASSSAPAPI